MSFDGVANAVLIVIAEMRVAMPDMDHYQYLWHQVDFIVEADPPDEITIVPASQGLIKSANFVDHRSSDEQGGTASDGLAVQGVLKYVTFASWMIFFY